MNKVQREVKEILKHSVLWTLYFVAILAVALVAIYHCDVSMFRR
ncbi:hypothetical protein [Vibrio vulnificus]|nr:hypothetical protein [Vibrio vulnificus]OJI17609.1 hypothetical protein VVORL1506_04239 [Vibrio vulnificus]OJI28072.1 hypothetical protein VVNSV5830_01000 [Vibrio vulnificus]